MKALGLVLLVAAGPTLACNAPIAGKDLVSGKAVQFLASSEKPVIAVFLSTVCPCSQSHESSLKTLAEQFPQFSWVGIHANQSESLAQGKTHFADADLGFPVIRDTDSKLANHFGALRTPHVFISNGTKECLYQGGVDDSHAAQKVETSYLHRALASLEQKKHPNPDQTRVLGCHIDR